MLGQPGVSHQAAPVPTSSTPGLSPLGPATEPLLGAPCEVQVQHPRSVRHAPLSEPGVLLPWHRAAQQQTGAQRCHGIRFYRANRASKGPLSRGGSLQLNNGKLITAFLPLSWRRASLSLCSKGTLEKKQPQNETFPQPKELSAGAAQPLEEAL